jgi:hypothetical protein
MTKQCSRRNRCIIAVIVAAPGLGSAATWMARNE